MQVDAPRTFIFDLDGKNLRVLVRHNYWEKYQKTRSLLEPLSIDVPEAALKNLGLSFLAFATYEIGLIEIQLLKVAIAIFSILGLVTVVPYEIEYYPSILPARFPFKLGSTSYQIEPL